MLQDKRLTTCEGLHGLQRAQHSVENGSCFGCMWWHNKSFRLRVYFCTQMPGTLLLTPARDRGRVANYSLSLEVHHTLTGGAKRSWRTPSLCRQIGVVPHTPVRYRAT